MSSKKNRCDYCSTFVRGRYATIITPKGETKYLHGKCRWFPESWEKLGLDAIKVIKRKGPHGEIFDFTQQQLSTQASDDVGSLLFI